MASSNEDSHKDSCHDTTFNSLPFNTVTGVFTMSINALPKKGNKDKRIKENDRKKKLKITVFDSISCLIIDSILMLSLFFMVALFRYILNMVSILIYIIRLFYYSIVFKLIHQFL